MLIFATSQYGYLVHFYLLSLLLALLHSLAFIVEIKTQWNDVRGRDRCILYPSHPFSCVWMVCFYRLVSSLFLSLSLFAIKAYPDTVTIYSRVVSLGKTSMTMEYDLRSDRLGGKTAARGKARVVFVDLTTLRPVPLPPLCVEILFVS